MNQATDRKDVALIAKEVRAKEKELGSILSVRTRRDFHDNCEGLWIQGSHRRLGEYDGNTIIRRFTFIGWLQELCQENDLEWINEEEAHTNHDLYILKRKKLQP
jgi:hypothetical protein